MMPILNAIASLAVRDISAASAWYASLLDREANARPLQEVVEWTFDRGGRLQLYQLPERAGSGSVTLAVDDIDLLATHLQQLNLAHGALTTTAQMRTIMLTDPDGNHIAFAQALEHTTAR